MRHEDCIFIQKIFSSLFLELQSKYSGLKPRKNDLVTPITYTGILLHRLGLLLVQWWKRQPEISVFCPVLPCSLKWTECRRTPFGHLFGCVAVSCSANVLFSTKNTLKYSPTTSNKRKCQREKHLRYFLLGIRWLWHKNSYNFLSASLTLFFLDVTLSDCCSSVCYVAGVQWRGSKDTSCPFWMPKLLQTFMERVKIAAICLST